MSKTQAKIARINAILAQFDERYLQRDPLTGQEGYPEWLQPIVAEMTQKLAYFESRKHAPRGTDDVDDEDDSYDGGDIRWQIDIADELPFTREYRRRAPSPRKPWPKGRQHGPLKTEVVYKDWLQMMMQETKAKLPKPVQMTEREQLLLDEIRVMRAQIQQLSSQLLSKADDGKMVYDDPERARQAEMDRRKYLALVQAMKEQGELLAKLQADLQEHRSAPAGGSGGLDEDLAKQRRELDHQRSQLDKGKGTLQVARQAEAEVRRDVDSLSKQREDLLKQIAHLKENGDRARFALMEQVTDLTNQLADLQDKYGKLRASSRDGEADLVSIKDRVHKLEQQLAASQKEAERLRALNEKADKKWRDWDEEFNRKKQDDEQMQRALAKKRVDDMPKRRAQALANLMARYMGVFYHDEFDKASTTVLQLQAEVQKLKRQLRDLHAEFQGDERKYASTAGDTDEILKLLRSRDHELNDLKSKMLELREANDDLEYKLGIKDQDIMERENRLARLMAQLEKRPTSVPYNQVFAQFVIDAFRGDYLRFNADSHVLGHIIYGQGDDRVIFSDLVEKINKGNKRQKRALALTDRGVYLLGPAALNKWTLKRRIPIAKLKTVSLSRNNADLFVLHHASEHDLCLLANKRNEVMYHLMRIWEMLVGRPMAPRYGESLFVSDRGMNTRQLTVQEGGNIVFGESNIKA